MSERDPHDVYHEDRDRREVEELNDTDPGPFEEELRLAEEERARLDALQRESDRTGVDRQAVSGPTPDPRVLVVTMVGENGTPADKLEIRENSWYAAPSRAQILLELTHRIDDAFAWLERRERT